MKKKSIFVGSWESDFKKKLKVHVKKYDVKDWTMKFGQLIQYNIKNFFQEKSCKKCGGEDSSKQWNIKISLD